MDTFSTAILMPYFVRALLIMAIIIAVTFFPYCPGGFDQLSNQLSKMAWALGRTGLAMVPVGILWILFSKVTDNRPVGWIFWLLLAACVFNALVLVLVAFAFGPLLSIATGTMAGLLILRLARILRPASRLDRTVPVLLIVAPIMIFVAQESFIEKLASNARDRVITNSAPLIAQIESHRSRHGNYPVSIFALYGDVKPAIVGVQRYYYEANGEAFNLIFEEPSPAFGLRRFVVYNPRDKQRLTVHETERLELDEAGLEADNVGYTIIQSLPQPKWKLFTFRS